MVSIEHSHKQQQDVDQQDDQIFVLGNAQNTFGNGLGNLLRHQNPAKDIGKTHQNKDGR